MVSDPKLTISQAIRLYNSFLRSSKYAPETQKHYSIDVTQFQVYLERSLVTEVGNVNRSHIYAFLHGLEMRNLSQYALYRKHMAIKSFFNFLNDSGYLSKNPVETLVPPERDTPLPRVLTTNEQRRLLSSCMLNIRDAAIIELLLETGLRVSELERLELSDVILTLPQTSRLNNEYLRVRGHGKRSRTLLLSFNAQRALQKWLKQRPKSKTQAIFVNRFNQTLTKRSIQSIVTKHLRNTRIPDASVHTLRHTFGVLQVMAGKSINEISGLLGHENTNYTKVYTTLADRLVEQELRPYARALLSN